MDTLINSWPPEGAAKGAGEPRASAANDAIISMPAESPLAMPTQHLFQFDPEKDQARVPQRSSAWCWFARLFAFGGGLALTAYGAYEMYEVVAIGGVTLLEWALVALFVANFSWIALAFTSACLGFLRLLFAPPKPPVIPATLRARTAIIMPIYNEAPERVFGAFQAMFEEVRDALGDVFSRPLRRVAPAGPQRGQAQGLLAGERPVASPTANGPPTQKSCHAGPLDRL